MPISQSAPIQVIMTDTKKMMDILVTLMTKRHTATGYWRLPTGYWRLATGDWLMETGDWLLETGYWRLATGDWLLATGDCLLKPKPHRLQRINTGRFYCQGFLDLITA